MTVHTLAKEDHEKKWFSYGFENCDGEKRGGKKLHMVEIALQTRQCLEGRGFPIKWILMLGLE